MKGKAVIAGLFLIAFGLIALALALTNWLFNPQGFNLLKYLLRAGILLVALVVFWAGLLKIVRGTQSITTKNIVAATGAFFSILILLEIVFTFVSVSCGGDGVLVAKNWFNYNWRQNKYGFRDAAPESIDRPDKKNLFVVGDSYVAGHGLKNEGDRFSNLLGKMAGDSLDVFNLGVCGADTKAEFEFLSRYPIKPNMLVVCHANNDIYTVLDKKGIVDLLKPDAQFMPSIKRFKPSKNPVVSQSFLLNFINTIMVDKKREQYFRNASKNYTSFESFLNSNEARGVEMCYYNNDSLLGLELKRMDKFIDYAAQNQVRLVYVLFPKLNDEVMNYTDSTANQPLARYLNAKGVEVLNLTPVLKPIAEKERVVSKFDPHPNVYANVLIAESLKPYFKP